MTVISLLGVDRIIPGLKYLTSTYIFYLRHIFLTVTVLLTLTNTITDIKNGRIYKKGERVMMKGTGFFKDFGIIALNVVAFLLGGLMTIIT